MKSTCIGLTRLLQQLFNFFSYSFLSLHPQVSHDFAINFNPEDDECEGKEGLRLLVFFKKYISMLMIQKITFRIRFV